MTGEPRAAHALEGRGAVRQALTGTLLAQGAALLATPLLTRLYGPAAVGTYVAALSACLIVSSVATLRLDLAVQRAQARQVPAAAGAALACALLLALLMGVAGALLQPLAPQVPGLGALAFAYGVVMGAQQVVTALLLRGERHAALSTNRAATNALIVLLQLGAATLGATATTLLLCDVLGRLLATLGALPAVRQVLPRVALGARAVLDTLRRERGLVRFATPAALLNNASVYALPVALALKYPAALVGQVAMTQKLVGLPLAVVGQALAQVYVAGAIRNLSAGGDARAAHLRTFTRLLGGMALALLAFVPLAPWAFRALLGPEWAASGVYYQLLAVSYAAQFVANPVSQTLNLHGAERWQWWWDAARFASVALVLLGGPALGLDLPAVLVVYAGVMTLAYLSLLLLSARAVRLGVA